MLRPAVVYGQPAEKEGRIDSYTEVSDPQFKGHHGLYLEIDSVKVQPKYEDAKKITFTQYLVLNDYSEPQYGRSIVYYPFKDNNYERTGGSMQYVPSYVRKNMFPDVASFNCLDSKSVDEGCITSEDSFSRVRKNEQGEELKSILIKIDQIKIDKLHVLFKDYLYKINLDYCLANKLNCRIHYIKKNSEISEVRNNVASIFLFSYLLHREGSQEDIGVDLSKKGIDSSYILPADLQDKKDQFFSMRGQYFVIYNGYSGKSNAPLPFYKDKDFAEAPAFKLASGVTELISEKIPVTSSFKTLDLSDGNSSDFYYYFKYSEIDSGLKFIKIKFGEKDYFFNLDDCLEQRIFCNFVNYPQTPYENRLSHLKIRKEKKDLSQLNDLIETLTPCIASKDVACINKSFVLKEDVYIQDEEVGCYDLSVEVPSYQFKLEDLDELKECLKYENLLPHFRGMKGINKVCIFAPEHTLKTSRPYKILAISHPNELKFDYTKYGFFSKNKFAIPLTQVEIDSLTFLRP